MKRGLTFISDCGRSKIWWPIGIMMEGGEKNSDITSIENGLGIGLGIYFF